jgi:hypothetical protein
MWVSHAEKVHGITAGKVQNEKSDQDVLQREAFENAHAAGADARAGAHVASNIEWTKRFFNKAGGVKTWDALKVTKVLKREEKLDKVGGSSQPRFIYCVISRRDGALPFIYTHVVYCARLQRSATLHMRLGWGGSHTPPRSAAAGRGWRQSHCCPKYPTFQLRACLFVCLKYYTIPFIVFFKRLSPSIKACIHDFW